MSYLAFYLSFSALFWLFDCLLLELPEFALVWDVHLVTVDVVLLTYCPVFDIVYDPATEAPALVSSAAFKFVEAETLIGGD